MDFESSGPSFSSMLLLWGLALMVRIFGHDRGEHLVDPLQGLRLTRLHGEPTRSRKARRGTERGGSGSRSASSHRDAETSRRETMQEGIIGLRWRMRTTPKVVSTE